MPFKEQLKILGLSSQQVFPIFVLRVRRCVVRSVSEAHIFFCCRYLVQKSVTVNTDADIFVALDRSITKLINVRASEVFPGMVRHKTKHMLTNGNKNCYVFQHRVLGLFVLVQMILNLFIMFSFWESEFIVIIFMNLFYSKHSLLEQ